MEAAAQRADGDFKDRRQERGSSRTIDDERDRVQGQASAMIAVTMTANQLQTLIAALRGGGGGAAAGMAGAATVVGTTVPCVLGKDKLKRPKNWFDWKKDAENKMRFLKIEDEQKLDFITSCAGAELTELWEKEVMPRFEAKVEEGARVEAHTYEQVMDDTKQTQCSQNLMPVRFFKNAGIMRVHFLLKCGY